jgi:hypothetical protein
MTQRTAKIAEICRRAISGDADYFSNDTPALRRAATENVKNIINRRHKTNAIMGEWLNARRSQ